MSTTCRLLLLFLVTTLSPAWAQAESLGRLFFTPQQRAALDRQRTLNRSFIANASADETSLTLNGEVSRSGGRSTRWINGQADWHGDTPRPGVPVGDTFHPGTGERESVIGNGRIVIKPGSATK